ncbi:polycystic kidney disease and receptor for egg jelly-related protein [Nannospalax galili]|uniref:polycystic kidney disease and receptor for egg jelly-related protein n=1 Tax=Nannospalax galili TaxID=1026970 RepID=UPI0004ED30BD|nr:polycystic kidney disease and receptor for egg jelly-related protein [Nannospalax galili]
MWPGPALMLLGLGLGLGRPPRSPGIQDSSDWVGSPRRARPAPPSRSPPSADAGILPKASDSSERGAAAPEAYQFSCTMEPVRIHRNDQHAPVVLSRKEEVTLNATANWNCPLAKHIHWLWQFYTVPSVNDTPDWARPVSLPNVRRGDISTVLHIPRFALPYGVYVFNFSLVITRWNPILPRLIDSDIIYIWVTKRPLQAVLPGAANVTVNFSDELILNGSMSSDPEADDPTEGLHFSWHCTTNPGNYRGEHVAVTNQEVCHPEQVTLDWPWAVGPVLTLPPETLKGDGVYYFRLVVQKWNRTAFSDKTIHVLREPTPRAHIACIENCDPLLVMSDRFSLFLNCTACTRRDFYNWSILSPSGHEVMFDWAGQSVTRRNRAYLSIKAFAFRNFLEARFWVSLHLITWGGVTLDLRYPFIINHGPQIGKCKVNPERGISMITKFVVECSNFQDKHTPLQYKIIVAELESVGEISSVEENTLGSILYLGTRATTPPSFLPVGVAADNYSLKIYAQVYDSRGTFSQVTLHAMVQAPTQRNSSENVLRQLLSLSMGPTSLLSTLLQKQDWLPAGYLIYVVASVLSNMKTELRDDKASLLEHLVNQSFVPSVRTVDEICQIVIVITKLTQQISDFTGVAGKQATLRLWQTNQALQANRRKYKHFSSRQIEIVSTGILTSLSNILKLINPYNVFEDPFFIVESLSDTILASKVPGGKTTDLSTSNFKMYVEKVEKWDVAQAFRNETHCQNCFHGTLNASRVSSLPVKALVSMMFCEFTVDPFPWLSYPEDSSAEVVGFRMTGATDNTSAIEIVPDVEVHLVRKDLTFESFKLTVGPGIDGAGFSKMTTGGVSFEVDSRGTGELLVHIVTDVTLLFKVLIYAGNLITPTNLVATFLVPHDTPPSANQDRQFDPTCTVKEARVVCLSQSLLQVMAQHSNSSKYNITMVLQAPRFVFQPTNKLVRIALFTAHCLDMDGIQSEWRAGTCVLGEKTTWYKVHCVCRNMRRSRRQLGSMELARLQLHSHFVTARVIVIPNAVDLHLTVIKNINQNPVTLLAVLFIMLLYVVLAFWALQRDEIDLYLRDHVVILPDNDPYDNICYLVTIFTGSRLGSGTRANVFVQLSGTKGTSDVHCLSHPYFKSLYRGSINTFLLTTQQDLGNIQSIRMWHDNEGEAPDWYLSRIKVENLFSRHIWLFMCRKWFSVDTTLEATFFVIDPDEPLNRRDFFLIDLSHKLGKNHMWFSIFTDVVVKSFNRLQRLSCCLATLLSSLLCNIMFFNLNRKERIESKEGRIIRSMMTGIESVLVTIPVQLLITFFFIYSQKKPQANLEEVRPQMHPLMSEEGGYWRECLDKWHEYEMERVHIQEAAKSRERQKVPKASLKRSLKRTHQSKKTQGEDLKTQKSTRSSSNNNVEDSEDDEDISSKASSTQLDSESIKKKPRLVLPWWCVYIAWTLVFITSGISSFFIVFYGLTYGYDKSVEWLLASFCSFCQSVFLVQPCKIVLLSGARTNKLKYCKNLSWSGKYQYTEIKLYRAKMSADKVQELHQHIASLQASRMYQPLTEDEIQIHKRKGRIKRRALLFLSYLLTHFTFLALLLLLIALLHHNDSFYYNQFIRHRFSVDLTTVMKLGDIYTWLNSVLLPLVHNNLNPTFLPDSSSKILGLPLMRQVRAKPSEKRCLPAQKFVQNRVAGEVHCYPEYGIDPEDTEHYSSFWNKVSKRHTDKNVSGFTYKPPEKKWPYYSHGVLKTYGSGGYVFHFFPEQQAFNSSLRLKELEGQNWLDEMTWAVIVELTTLNPDASLICSISIVFELSPLGTVNSSLSVCSFSLADFNRETSAEIYLYVAILIFYLAYIVDEGYVILQERASYLSSGYSLFNFTLKCMFTLLIVLFFKKHLLAIGMIHLYLTDPQAFIPFHAISRIDHIMRTVLAFLLFLTILKTLRYARFFYNVRLAQRAIQAALPGICHIALVVSVCSFVYMAFGYLVFGQHEWHYSNMIHATQTIFSYCVSAFQNTEFSSNRVLGVLFLSSFLLVMICILINLFQVVILAAYDEMKQPVYEEPSDEVEAVTYLCGKLRAGFDFLTSRSRNKDQSNFFVDMLYGQPEKNTRRYLGLKTRNINGKKMVYLVV